MPKHLAILAVMLVVVSSSAIGQGNSQQSSPCPAPKAAVRRPPKQVTTCCCGQPSAEQRGSEASPFVIKLVQPDQAQGESTANKAIAPKNQSQPWSLADRIAAIASIAGFLQFIALVFTIGIMVRNGQRQLRAYVLVERGIVANVANPLSEFGQKQETAARILAPYAGPTAQITIKNTGQTPAYDLVHWGVISIQEFPLNSPLPTMPRPALLYRSVLGPAVVEVKTLRLPQPLTEEQIQGLRDCRMAIYCHGEIHYRDAFNKRRVSHYRVMYCAVTGIEIGVSTDLTLCEEGNEAE